MINGVGPSALEVPKVADPRRVDPGAAQFLSLPAIRRLGFAVLALQLVVLVVWSQVRVERFALTWDFSYYFQSWWLIAHGDLDPFTTVHGFFFWQNHGEFLLWPFALLGSAWANPVSLLWLQCAGLVGAEVVAFDWICDLVAGACRSPLRRAGPGTLAAAGLVLLVADPWLYWSVSFDFHFQLVGLVFLLLAARTLFTAPRSKLLWLWAALALLSGDVVATYLAGVGAGAALAVRTSRWRPVLVTAVSVLWVVLLTAIHANQGSELGLGYGYLAAGAGAASSAQIDILQILLGIVRHPREVATMFLRRWLDVYATLGPSGLIGVFSPGVWLAVLVVLLENSLNRYLLYLVPGFQDVLIYVLVPVGTVDVLARLRRRVPRVTAALCALVVLAAVGWSAVWLPRLATQWLRVSPGAASALASAERQIPASDEVVAWQGVAGPLSGRRWFYPVLGPSTFPVHTSTVWVVVAPSQGIELAPVVVADAFIDELAGPLHARMVVDRDGVWVFRWQPSPRARTLVVPRHPTSIAAWSTPGSAARATTVGPVDHWRAVATGQPGYVVAEDYWPEPPARYRVTAVLSNRATVNVEVWNATGNVLLGRRTVVPAAGRQRAVSFDVDATRRYPANVYAGSGPFRMDPLQPPPDDELEIRIWTPGEAAVSVSELSLHRVGR